MKRAERRDKTQRVAKRRLKIASIIGTPLEHVGEGFFKKTNIVTNETDAKNRDWHNNQRKRQANVKDFRRNGFVEDDSES